MDKKGNYAVLLLLLALIIAVYAAASFYFQRMSDIWMKLRRMEILKNDIKYLQAQADEHREAAAPLVLRLFSYSKEDTRIKILFAGKEIWIGKPDEMNFTYEVEYFGKVRIWSEDGKFISSIVGMPYRYVLSTDYHYEEFVHAVQYYLWQMDKAIMGDKEELSNLEKEARSLSNNPIVLIFLAAPLISIALQFISLYAIDVSSALKYSGVLSNPYVLIPTLAVYLSFAVLTFLLHSGTLIPLHTIAVLYLLTSFPSAISPIIFIYERIIE